MILLADREGTNQTARMPLRYGYALRHVFAWRSLYANAIDRKFITKTCLIKYIENFTTKNRKFSDKTSDIFQISAQNIDCRYS